MTVAAIIVAGGAGERFGSSSGKQLALVAGRPMLARTVEVFEGVEMVDSIVVVTHPERVEEYASALRADSEFAKVCAIVAGGDTRQESVAAGMAAVPKETDIVAVHDGARPLVTSDIVVAVLEALLADDGIDGAAAGYPVFDSVHEVGDGGCVRSSLNRSAVWAAQTPQAFRYSVLEGALRSAQADGFVATDDVALVSKYGGTVTMVHGRRDNVKVTLAEDVAFAEWVLSRDEE